MTKIAVPVRNLDQLKKVTNAGIIEIWCDQLTQDELEEMLGTTNLPVILNLKGPEEKGTFEGTMKERFEFLGKGLKMGADLIDLPFTPGLKLPNKKVVLSYHNFEETPEKLEEILAQMSELQPAIIKIATMVNSEEDLNRLIKLQVDHPGWANRRCIIGMGEKGRSTRILAPVLDNAFTFASLDDKTKTAPGQLTAEELKSEWSKVNE